MRILVPALLLSLLAAPVLASDGVLEINQTCAVQTGCFAGDVAGFPVTIDGTAGRSYRLTSDVRVTIATPNSDGILVNTSQVTIDLGGFSLNGPTIGSGSGFAISGGGTDGAFAGLLSVRNGSLRGWKSGGLFLPAAAGARIENLSFDFNDGVAIQVGEDALVSNNRIAAGGSASSVGIVVGARSIVSGNVVRELGGSGITCSAGGCLVSGNAVSDNGGDGIQTGTGSSVNGNTLIGNDGYGLQLTGSTGYRDNTIFVLPPAVGTVIGGTNAGGNVCNASSICP